MSDLGGLVALIADIEAKVTTNGNGENTGARVQQSLKNIADTLNGLIAAGTKSPQGWKLTANTANTDPNDGTQINFSNNANIPASTMIGLGHNADNGTATAAWAALANGGKLYIVDAVNDVCLEYTVTAVEDVGTSTTVTVTGGLGSAPADGATCYVLAVPMADSHPDTIVVSGAGTAAVNGTYRRGEGADAYVIGTNGIARPAYIKEGSTLDQDAITCAGSGGYYLKVGGNLYAYTEINQSHAIRPWHIDSSLWLLGDDDSPNACTVAAGGGKVLDPRAVVVSGAGTSACDGTYLEAGVYNGRPWYQLVGGSASDPVTGDSVYWTGTTWDVYNTTSLGGGKAYDSSDDVAFPWLASFAVNVGDTPVPSITQGYTTVQDALDSKAQTISLIGGYAVELTSVTDGDMLTFDATAGKWINQAP